MKKTDDLIGSLKTVVQGNTQHYQSDFDYDTETLREAAKKAEPEDRTFYWMSRPSGTWCLAERDVLLRDSEAYGIWTHYGDHPDGILTLRVEVTDIDKRSGNIRGTIQPFHYARQVKRIREAALPIHHATGVYRDGTAFSVPGGKFNLNELLEHGGIKEKRYEPENADELSNLIRKEHQLQDKEGLRTRKKKSVER